MDIQANWVWKGVKLVIYFDIRATIYQKLSNKVFLGTLNENRDKKGTKFLKFEFFYL